MQVEDRFISAQCFKCKHLIFTPAEFRCPAFDNFIPDDILINKFEHTKKHPDQKNNILFEGKVGKDE